MYTNGAEGLPPSSSGWDREEIYPSVLPVSLKNYSRQERQVYTPLTSCNTAAHWCLMERWNAAGLRVLLQLAGHVDRTFLKPYRGLFSPPASDRGWCCSPWIPSGTDKSLERHSESAQGPQMRTPFLEILGPLFSSAPLGRIHKVVRTVAPSGPVRDILCLGIHKLLPRLDFFYPTPKC